MERKNRHSLEEELRETVSSAFIVLVGVIISIYFGNVSKELFGMSVAIWLYPIACYIVPFVFMLLEFWLVARTSRLVKEINSLQ